MKKLLLVFLFGTMISFGQEKRNHHNKLLLENGRKEFIGLSPEDFQPAYDSMYLFVDEQSFPKFYYQDIFTPVCEDNSCKPVYITLMWDLLGNYLDYKVDPKWPLTKIDHLPFSDEEYEKLHLVLANDHSILGSYTKKNIAELWGESNGDVKAKTPGLGIHNLKVTPYNNGKKGTPFSINFSLIDQDISGD